MWFWTKCKEELEQSERLNESYAGLVKQLEDGVKESSRIIDEQLKLIKKQNEALREKKIVIPEDGPRKHHTHLKEDEKKELLDTFKKNKHLTKKQIAEYYNISYSTLCALLRANKITD